MILCGVCQEVLDFYNEDIIVIDDEYVHLECADADNDLDYDEDIVLPVDEYMRTKYQRE
jgi:hypothetical protein